MAEERVTVPTHFKHLYEIIMHRGRCWPHQIALGGQDDLGWKEITGEHLHDLVDWLAAELADYGVGTGDRVILWLPNSWRTPIYYFALWKLGAIVVPFDREMNPQAAERIRDQVEACLIIGSSGDEAPWSSDQPITAWWEPGSRGGQHHRRLPWQPPQEELATLSFTSGTTGHPKGCMITHANLCFEVNALPAIIPLDTTSRLASILPLSHLFELTCGLLYPLAMGAAINYVPSRRSTDILRVLADQRITHMVVVPQILSLMGSALETNLQARLTPPIATALLTLSGSLPMPLRRLLFRSVHRRLGGALHLLAVGGAALSPQTQRLWERLGIRVVQGYGTSETAPVVAAGQADGTTPVGSVGRPLPGVAIRLSEAGELLVRGPNVMRGYWREPQLTADVLTDGWYATGDMATIDEHANLWILGRTKELIIQPSGLKIWPPDVEAVLSQHPEVRDAVVIATANEGGSQRLHAYLLAAQPPGRAASLPTIIAEANSHLARHQRVTTAAWWSADDFPRTALGKVRRHLIPPPSQPSRAADDTVQPINDPVAQAIATLTPMRLTGPEQTLAELGLDSLNLVELSLALEEIAQRPLGDNELQPEMTIGQVRALVHSPPAGWAPPMKRGVVGPDHPVAHGRLMDHADWPYTWGRHLRWLRAPVDLIFRLAVTRIVIIGADTVRDLPAATILAGTHRSFADVPLLIHALSRSPARHLSSRLIIPAAASGILRYPVYGWWSRLAFGLYPVSELGVVMTNLHHLVRLARHGNVILIFPQGQHVAPQQEYINDPMVAFHPGVTWLAEALDAVVVPFGLAGSERLVPPDLRAFKGWVIAGIPLAIHRGPLAVAFGPPLRRAPDETALGFTARLQAASFALARQAEAALESISEAGPVGRPPA